MTVREQDVSAHHPGVTDQPDTRPEPTPAIRAQNPDLDTAWRTIAWWEQTADYWRTQAYEGYALRDRIAAAEQAAAPTIPATLPEREWALRAENGLTTHTSEETALAAITNDGYTIDDSPVVAAMTRLGPDDEWVEFTPTLDLGENPKPWAVDLHAVTLIRDVAEINGKVALTVWNALAPLLGHVEREARLDERRKMTEQAATPATPDAPDTDPRTT